jgi:hypothetical protein
MNNLGLIEKSPHVRLDYNQELCHPWGKGKIKKTSKNLMFLRGSLEK